MKYTLQLASHVTGKSKSTIHEAYSGLFKVLYSQGFTHTLVPMRRKRGI